MSYYYKILLLAFIIPFIFSFHPKVNYYQKFKYIIFSIPLTAVPFIVWDIFFTNNKVWGFNTEFHSNFLVFALPLEEVLFFIMIPFCCLYTYYLIERYRVNFFKNNNYKLLDLYFGIFLLIISLSNYDKNYTFSCFLLASIIIFFNHFAISNAIDKQYYITLMILILFPFIIVNGALTGLFFDQVVVWYNPEENLGIRFLSIPVEDFFYAHVLIYSNLIIYKYIENSDSSLK